MRTPFVVEGRAFELEALANTLHPKAIAT